ncbi:hypothetical protein O0I10_008294 [Lichtheimia ornata]|uniref:Amino acid transporter transmembrane domain-containing protein n=1 Tax=Lichtheimia ornata TaxID=688661 RepID=A0AAD7V054_9FUNG|nr:uncharacterized protein O0I10_008294 [Lichtheimia ornata]KAJ8656071.1 hypothetical protein O0I10_008294 [Lichtheimia ornata]
MERSLTVDLPVDQVARVVRRHLVVPPPPPPTPPTTTTPVSSTPAASQIPQLRRRNGHTPNNRTTSYQTVANSIDTPIYNTHHLLPGGAIVDEIYKWTARVEEQQQRRRQSISLPAIRSPPLDDDPLLQCLKQPGGFRRYHALNNAARHGKSPPNFVTSSFVEFLYLYGHFGGEDLSDDDDDDDDDDSSSCSSYTSSEESAVSSEEHDPQQQHQHQHQQHQPIMDEGRRMGNGQSSHVGIQPRTTLDAGSTLPVHHRHSNGTLPLPVTNGPSSSSRRRVNNYQQLYARETMPLLQSSRRQSQAIQAKATPGKAMFLLLKSFVTTGIMFLPKAFYNGGLVASTIGIVIWSLISLWSFLLLVQTRLVVHASFGEMGGVLYGHTMRVAVLVAITLSQIGFVCAYMVFVSENLQALVLAFSKCRVMLPMHLLVLAQSFAFIPLAMIRKIQRLSVFALIADIFIVIGLGYLFYYELKQLVVVGQGVVSMWSPMSFPLFIGTVAFTYEGIGLVIPITESMKEPQKFPGVLRRTLIVITTLFISLGAVSYLAFGEDVQTIILLNLPSKDPVVSSIQTLYSLAICLSIPLQLFPAIRIMENGLFTTRSGKNNAMVKWQKNVFRVLVVFLCAWIAIVGSKDKLDKFVALIGALFCIPLCFVFPPLFHMKALSLSKWRLAADVALILFGVGCMLYVVSMTLYQWNAGDIVDPVKQCVSHRT